MAMNQNGLYTGPLVPGFPGAYQYPGSFLEYVRSACERQIQAIEDQSQGWRKYTSSHNVTECVLQSLPEETKAVLAGRAIILTLWPSFIGAITATAPDPSSIVYDNIWWASLFAATCGGFPGLSQKPMSHQLEARSYEKAKRICEGWSYNPLYPRKISRSSIRRYAVSPYFETGQWIAFIWSCALFLAWNIVFAITLTKSICLALPTSGASPGVWYWISAVPGFSQALLHLAQNNVEIFLPMPTGIPSGTNRSALLQGKESLNDREPMDFVATRIAASTAVAVAPALSPRESSTPPNDLTTICYQRLETRSGPHTWLCILRHQWHRRPYRLLVKQAPKGWNWFNAMFELYIAFWRLTMFALGSIVMANVVLMPIPNDLVLFVLLIFMTATPRFFWPAFWTKGKRGADLVVFVKTQDADEFTEGG